MVERDQRIAALEEAEKLIREHFTSEQPNFVSLVRQLLQAYVSERDNAAALEADYADWMALASRRAAQIVALETKLAQAQAEAKAAHVAGLRPVVRGFAALMERQLRANDHKPGWADDTDKDLLLRLYEEIGELHQVVYYNHHPELVGKEAADVANFAMMIADNAQAIQAAVEQEKAK